MFGTYLAPTRTEYVTQKVHEHRAPTDESVKLLREMEQAAKDSVDSALSIGGNGFECVVHCHKDMLDMTTTYAVLFSLNGCRMRSDTIVREWEDLGHQKKLERIRQDVANKIATKILTRALSASMLGGLK